MAQLNLYLQEPLFKRISLLAKKRKISISSFVRQQLESSINESWPVNFFELCGILDDKSFKRPPQEKESADIKREKF
jgi:hypothetical protein